MLKYYFDIIFFMVQNLHSRPYRYQQDGRMFPILTMISLGSCGIILFILWTELTPFSRFLRFHCWQKIDMMKWLIDQLLQVFWYFFRKKS